MGGSIGLLPFRTPFSGRALYCPAVQLQVGHTSDHIPVAMREPPSPMPLTLLMLMMLLISFCIATFLLLLCLTSFKAVMDIFDATIRCGVSLSRSVELTAQWDQILAIGPIYPVTGDDLSVGRGLGIGVFFDAAAGVHRRFCEVIHQVVVIRRSS